MIALHRGGWSATMAYVEVGRQVTAGHNPEAVDHSRTKTKSPHANGIVCSCCQSQQHHPITMLILGTAVSGTVCVPVVETHDIAGSRTSQPRARTCADRLHASP